MTHNASPAQVFSMTAFVIRLREALGEKGYHPGARRSVQSAVLYEANR